MIANLVRLDMKIEHNNLKIDDALLVKLSSLAEQSGQSLQQFADNILRDHIVQAEANAVEYAEDEKRWKNYIASGHSIPHTQIRDKLQGLVLKATQIQDIQ